MKNPAGYYVYAYLDPRKLGKFSYLLGSFLMEPFYVGKGYGRRQLKHLTDRGTSLKTQRITEIAQDGSAPVIIKLAAGLLEADAFEMERAWIAAIGRASTGDGPLTNKTSGGQGPSGFSLSEESRQKIREKLKDRPLTEAHRFKMKGRKAWNKGMTQPAEVKIKLSAALKGRPATEQQKERARIGRENMSAATRERLQVTMFKKGQSPHNKNVPLSEEQKRRLVELRAKNPITEETRQKMRIAHLGKSSGRKGKKASEEARRKMSESRKAFLARRHIPGDQILLFEDTTD